MSKSATTKRTQIAIAQWAQKITAAWSKVGDGVFEIGRLLNDAKAELEYGEWTTMVEGALPFSLRTAQRFMAIAADENRIRTIAHEETTNLSLPPEPSVLYQMSRLPDETLRNAIRTGAITPATTVNDIKGLVQAEKREARQRPAEAGGTVEDLRALIAAGRRFPKIVADPPWPYETWSDKGATRSAVQHYETMSLDDIAALPVEQLAEPDALLHLWVIGSALDVALDIMIEAWKFEYVKIGFVWLKLDKAGAPKMITGHWTRDECEVCLLGKRGAPKRDDAGVRQVIQAPVGPHSAKPEEYRERVDRLSGGPTLELFGRTPRANWTVWGNQIAWKP